MNTTYWAGYTLFKCAAKAFFAYRVENEDKLLQEGGALIVANHESFLDPPFIGVAFHDAIYYLARKTLFRGPTSWLYPRWNAIPVDQDNPDMTSLKKIIKLLKQGERVLLFPEGERTLSGELGSAEAGVGLIAARAGVPVQPVRIKGAFEALPRGSGKLKRHPITIAVGDPIDFSQDIKKAKGRDAYQQIADQIMDEIAAL